MPALADCGPLKARGRPAGGARASGAPWSSRHIWLGKSGQALWKWHGLSGIWATVQGCHGEGDRCRKT